MAEPRHSTGTYNAWSHGVALVGVRLGVLVLSGGLLIATTPSLAVLAIGAGFLTMMMAGLELIAAQEVPGSAAERAFRLVVRVIAPALAAVLAWLAIASARMAVGEGPVAAAIALPAILAILAAESLAAIGLQRLFARVAGRPSATPVSMLLADKYGEFSGSWR